MGLSATPVCSRSVNTSSLSRLDIYIYVHSSYLLLCHDITCTVIRCGRLFLFFSPGEKQFERLDGHFGSVKLLFFYSTIIIRP